MRQITVALGAALFGLIGAAGSAHADDAACHERFKELLLGGNASNGPVRIHVTQTYAGNTTENYFYSTGPATGDGLMQPLKNMGNTWVLFRDRKMYTSPDGKAWTLVRELDAASDPSVVKNKLREDSATAASIVCGEAVVDGAPHEVVEGEYISSLMQGAKVFHKYWVNSATGWITRTETRSTIAGSESLAIQVLEPAPEFEFPTVN